jgi:hypothetical protein
VGSIQLDLPQLNWSWYPREETVGQVRRRLIEHCRPRISRAKADEAMVQKLAQAA